MSESSAAPEASAAPVDLDSLTPEERAAYEKYGRLPKQSDFVNRVLKGKEKGRFDSADFEMQKKSRPAGRPGLRVAGAGGGKPPIPADVRQAMQPTDE